MNFREATALTRLLGHAAEAEGRAQAFSASVPDGWQQGAGAFGGLVLGLMVRAIEAVAKEHPLRSLTAEIPAPVVPGETLLVAEVLRAGQSVVAVAVRLMQAGELKGHAVGVLGAARRGVQEEAHEDAPPKARPWRDVPPVPADTPLLPTFAKHFAFRPVDGMPFSGGEPRTTGWIQLREPDAGAPDMALVVAHVDAWWPAELTRMSVPRPMVTAAFTMQVIGGPGVWTGQAPLLHTSRTLASHEGYVAEARQLWTEDGKLVALNQQTLVVVK